MAEPVDLTAVAADLTTPCAWCELPALGTADSSSHGSVPSCGTEGHGLLFGLAPGAAERHAALLAEVQQLRDKVTAVEAATQWLATANWIAGVSAHLATRIAVRRFRAALDAPEAQEAHR